MHKILVLGSLPSKKITVVQKPSTNGSAGSECRHVVKSDRKPTGRGKTAKYSKQSY